jgi:hypothetical protein
MIASNILFNTLRNHLARESNRLKFRWVLIQKRESVYLSRTHIRCRTQFEYTNRDVSCLSVHEVSMPSGKARAMGRYFQVTGADEAQNSRRRR